MRFLTWGAAGLAFGAALVVLGFAAAGTGHGCFVPIGLAAGPAGLISLKLRDAIASFAAPPVLWPVYGLLAAWWGRSGKAASRGRKLLIVHNAVGLLIVSPIPGTYYSDWGDFRSVWPVATLCLLLYIVGQYGAWRLLPKLDRKGS